MQLVCCIVCVGAFLEGLVIIELKAKLHATVMRLS